MNRTLNSAVSNADATVTFTVTTSGAFDSYALTCTRCGKIGGELHLTGSIYTAAAVERRISEHTRMHRDAAAGIVRNNRGSVLFYVGSHTDAHGPVTFIDDCNGVECGCFDRDPWDAARRAVAIVRKGDVEYTLTCASWSSLSEVPA